MTERRGDQGFSVAPQPIGAPPGGGRGWSRRRLGVALVLAVGAAIVTIAWLGPRLSGRPNFEVSFFATPTPSATATPTDQPTPILPVRATPLPEITRTEGALPQGRVAILADGLRVLDLATGSIEAATPASFGTDGIVRAPDGRSWTCVCMVDDFTASQPARTVRVISIGPDGQPTDSSDVINLPGSSQTENGQPDPLTDVDIRPDGRRGVLAVAKPVGETWRFSVASIDVDGRRAGPLVELGVATAPSPSPSPQPSPASTQNPDQPNQVYVDGPHVRIAPDGRVAFVWGTLQRATEDGGLAPVVHAWRIVLDGDGSISGVASAGGLDRWPVFCNGVGFAASDRLAWLCPKPTTDTSPTDAAPPWVLETIGLDGQPAGSVEISLPPDRYFSEPLFDRANGQVYAWDPNGLTIVRIDVRTLATDTVTLDPAAHAAPGVAPGGGTAEPVWRDADSAVPQFGASQIAGAPDGSRLFALGFEQDQAGDASQQGSRGIFVLDRATLALVGHWAPAADYLGISALSGGLVAATGLPGVDAQGHEAPWQGSLTIHDPADGRILVRFGQLGQSMPPLVVGR